MKSAPRRAEEHRSALFHAQALLLAPRETLAGGWLPHPTAVRLEVTASALFDTDRKHLRGAGFGVGTEHTRGTGRLTLAGDLASLRGVRSKTDNLELLVQTAEAARAPRTPPVLAGVLNATPDSFSDGGLHLAPHDALAQAQAMLQQGASWLDVGGESTRPGAPPVSLDEEMARVLPVLEQLAPLGTRISIDTRKARVAEAALDLGATVINDVSAGQHDPEMLALAAERKAGLVLMHAQGEPEHMQAAPQYRDPVAEVTEFLRARVHACLKAGIEPSRIWIDPGIGFGKRLEHNLALLRRLGELRSLGLPLFVGTSRKSFIAHISGAEDQSPTYGEGRRDRPEQRLGGTAASVTTAVLSGASVLRVHDVGAMAEAAAVAYAIAGSPTEPGEFH